jgi:hypothetical protein
VLKYINKDYIIKNIKTLIKILIFKSDLILYNYNNYYYIKFKEIISRKLNNLINIFKFIDYNILSLFKIKRLKKKIIYYCILKISIKILYYN